MTPQELFEFAVEDPYRRYHKTHVSMVSSRDNTERMWHRHVASVILPAYRRDRREPYDGLSVAGLDEAATLLRRYYEEHIKEAP